MTCQFGGNEAGSGGVAGEVVQDLAQGLLAFAVALAEQAFVAGLVPGGFEACRAARIGLAIAFVTGLVHVGRRGHAPARQNGRKGSHVGLRVDAGPGGRRAERVQFDDFTRQVLVQAGDPRRLAVIGALGALGQAPDHGRVGPGRLIVVEVAQHGWVGDRGAQQVFEAAGDVRADCFALEGADQAAGAGLGHRDGEVIGPEQGQAFSKRPIGERGCRQPRARVCQHQLAEVIAELLLRGGLRAVRHGWRRGHGVGFTALAPLLHELGMAAQTVGGTGQRLARQAADLQRGRPDLARQPIAGVAAQGGVELRLAETEAMRGDGGQRAGGQFHVQAPAVLQSLTAVACAALNAAPAFTELYLDNNVFTALRSAACRVPAAWRRRKPASRTS